jgi:hypothetical protein
MEGFVFAGAPVPNMGSSNFGNLNIKNRYTGKSLENNFDGGDPWLQYRFWNMAENGYNRSTDYDAYDKIDLDASEEPQFLGNLFPCRRDCKEKLGGKGAGFRECLRQCRGKGDKKSVLATKDADTQAKIAEALNKMADADAADSQRQAGSSNTKTILWVVLGIVFVAIIIAIIYFINRNKSE